MREFEGFRCALGVRNEMNILSCVQLGSGVGRRVNEGLCGFVAVSEMADWRGEREALALPRNPAIWIFTQIAGLSCPVCLCSGSGNQGGGDSAMNSTYIRRMEHADF